MPIFTKLSKEEVSDLLAKQRGSTLRQDLINMLEELDEGESAILRDVPIKRVRQAANAISGKGFTVRKDGTVIRVLRHG